MNDAHPPGGTPFLLVAHPGHELRLFRWMELHRPRVFILSDGSGGAASSRLHHSAATLARTGAVPGEVFGRLPDRAWYAALLDRDSAPFAEAVATIAAAARRHRPALLVSDAVDGHNPLHDLCEAIGSAVVAELARDGITLRHLVAAATATGIGRDVETLRLDAAAMARKRDAAAAYAPLAEEVTRILDAEPEALGTERLLAPAFDWPGAWEPEWEAFGRRRVAEGRFARAISYAEHVRPIARRLGPAAAAVTAALP